MAYHVNEKYQKALSSLTEQAVNLHQRAQDYAIEASKILGLPKDKAVIILSDCILTRTSLMNVQNFFHRGITQYKIESILAENTCTKCGKRDGSKYALSEARLGKNLPPFHPGCRCTIMEVPKQDFHTDFSKMPKNYGGSLFDTSDMS